jgi:hypothetical protein
MEFSGTIILFATFGLRRHGRCIGKAKYAV